MAKMKIMLFICFISFFGLITIFTPDTAFSEDENRILAQMPSPTLKKIKSGKFMKEFEVYLQDQFFGKHLWLTVKSQSEQARLQQENNGVFIGKDHFLLQPFKLPEKQFQQNITYLQHFSEKTAGIEKYIMLVPTSAEIYADKLPAFAPTENQAAILQTMPEILPADIDFISPLEKLLSHNDDYLYFKTDHHWTMRGAYHAYTTLGDALGFPPYALNDFIIEKVSDDFLGTLYSKAKLANAQPDDIEVFKLTLPISYEVTYPDTGKTSSSLYEWSHLKEKDQYSVFLDGNHRLVKITSNVDSSRKLAVIKDSYAHALLPFLANHFDEIHVIDLRYFHDSIYNYLETQKLTEVLFLYNLPNFAEDTNLIWLRQ